MLLISFFRSLGVGEGRVGGREGVEGWGGGGGGGYVRHCNC